MNGIIMFMQSSSPWVYVFIFFGKICEVSISTLRIVLISKGERLVGSLVAIVEMTLWVFITGSVITGLAQDPIKVVFLVTAFALGNFIGSWLEEKLAFGLSGLQITLSGEPDALNLAEALRENNFGVTTVEGKGIQAERQILMVTLRRKRVKEALELINKTVANAVITITEVKSLKGGFLRYSVSRAGKIRDWKK